MTTLAPTLADLRSALARAEFDLKRADMGIDDFQRRELEMARCRRRIKELQADIARIEESM